MKEALRRWAAAYDQTLNQEDPASSGFSSEAAEGDFEAEGLRLRGLLRAELGPEAEVTYFSQRESREIAG